MSGPISYAKMAAGAGEFMQPPAHSTTLVRLPEDKCPNYALSCMSKKYDDCCVPSKGCLTFAQQWIVENKNDNFHIHGLWPGNCPGDFSTEEFCGYSPSYHNVENIVNSDRLLQKQMIDFMPPKKPSTREEHWGHQWRKHGTCLSTIRLKCHEEKDPGKDAIRYFNTNLKLYYNYDVYRELDSHGIVPRDNPYTKVEFLAGLNKWSNIVSIYCYNNKLKEVRFSLLGKAYNNFVSRPDPYRGNCTDTIYYQTKTSSRKNTPDSSPDSSPNSTPSKKNKNKGWTTVGGNSFKRFNNELR